MSYTKQTWATGDTVTAAKLNHMEDGIEAAGGSSGGGVLEVHDVENTLDKTAGEIFEALSTGAVELVAIASVPDVVDIVSRAPITLMINDSTGYTFGAVGLNTNFESTVVKYAAATSSDYPTAVGE